MAVSVFDLFKIGIGPSSSHTVGPMRAANMFIAQVMSHNMADRIHSIKTELYGSLSHTGRGHGTDKAIILGLLGEEPDTVDPDIIPGLLEQVEQTEQIQANDNITLAFKIKKHLVWHKRKKLPLHSNGMQFTALDKNGDELLRKAYYSVGGGFILAHSHMAKEHIMEDDSELPYKFTSGDELIELCHEHKMTIAQIMYANEEKWHEKGEIDTQLDNIWQAMELCVQRGIKADGVLPGGLKVVRRAPKIFRDLDLKSEKDLADPLTVLDWI
ncbi:UNVERIFIED_CONTAM: hypothetical protein GTU68_024004, partial [Idotea baltica]|nr:hypothetical protein [Idotea baltica]